MRLQRSTWGVVLLALLVALPALARVGGGQGFSSGSHSSSSGGSGGSGGGGELIYLLFRLCVEFPAVGIPLLILVVAYLVWQANNTVNTGSRNHVYTAPGGRQGPASPDVWAELVATDPAFSKPVLDDLVQLVYRRGWEAASRKTFAPLAPWLSEAVQNTLTAELNGAKVDEIVVAAMNVERVNINTDKTTLFVLISGSRRELQGAAETRRYTEQLWTFSRPTSVRSPSPKDVSRMGCPSCGAAVQCDDLGRCTSCSTPILKGQHSWQAVEVRTIVARPVTAPQLTSWTREEPGYSYATITSPDLAAQVRAFHGRHPTFSAADFDQRVRHAFTALQRSWGEGRWEDARPFTTDMSWNTLRFWIDTYEASGLINRTSNVNIETVEVVKITMDAWYEAVTVRLRASMHDWVEERATKKVVSGDATRPRKFSEYWTFVRAIGTGDASKDPARCPSCGAPLDKVNAAGVCGYCDSVITTGQFDWVLTRIDQPEVYRG